MALMPIVGGAGMVMMMMSSGNPIRMAIGSVMIVVVLFTAVGAFARNRTGKRKQAEDDRVRFIEHLGQVEQEIRERAQTQRSEALMRNPAPEMLADVVRDPYRIWERRRGDEDFLITRIGSGIGELATHVFVKPTNDPMAISEPIAQAHLDRMLRRTRTIEGLPMSIPARGVISLVGPLEQTTAAVRSIVLQAAVFHAPTTCAFTSPNRTTATGFSGCRTSCPPELFDGPIGKREVSHDEESATELVEEIASRVEELAEKSKYREATLDRPFFMVIVDMDTPARQVGGRPAFRAAERGQRPHGAARHVFLPIPRALTRGRPRPPRRRQHVRSAAPVPRRNSRTRRGGRRLCRTHALRR